jgi:hypothetical protein
MPTYKCRFCSDEFHAAARGYVWCYACGGVGDDSDMIVEVRATSPDLFVPHRWEFARERRAA